MGSAALAAEDESQPSTSNGKSCKLSTTFVDGCGASVPRKQRSAVKKRGRESLISPRKKHHHALKKSKLNMKQGDISKDEEEVAETLYALAGLFSDANKADKPEPCSMNGPQDEGLSRKQAVRPDAYENQSDINPGSTSRPVVSTLGMNQSGGKEIHLDRITANGKNCSSIGHKYKDFFPSPNLYVGGGTCSETHKSCPSARIAYLLESTTFSSKNRITTEMRSRVGPKSNESWKRCSGHIYISRLIKVLQISELNRSRANGRNGNEYIRKDQDQQMACETSASKQVAYNFLSLGTELPKQFHKLCSLPQNSAQQLSQYHSNNFTAEMEQKWAHYYTGRSLHALRSKYQQQQVLAIKTEIEMGKLPPSFVHYF